MENIAADRTPKKRSVARRAGVAVCWFFAVMLVLTYLSKAVSESLKAQVETGYAGSSMLDESVEGTGVWVAGETRFYTTRYSRRVAQIFVRPGETVTAGDPLFAYDVSAVKGGKKVSDKALREAEKALTKAEKAVDGASDPVYAEHVLDNARQGLAYAEFAYAQAYALQNGGVVRASFSGTVVKCDLSAGKSSTAGSSGFEIAPDGVVFSMTVSEKDAKHIATGDPVILYTDGREEKEMLTVDAIELPDANGDVPVKCSGDAGKAHLVNARQDWKIKKQSARYQQTIPVAALRQSGGEEYYVLLLTEKETIIGTQLIAKKQSVKLLAHDSKLAAIDGGVSERDRLITTSTKELKDGDYVVLKDAS